MAMKGACPVIAICLTLVIDALCSVASNSVHTENAEYGVDEDELGSVYGLPGVQFEYQIEVGAGRIQCFFQHLRQDSELHVAFEVLRGADKNINFKIKMQNGLTVEHFQWTNEGNLDTVVNDTGEYAFCFDNGLSRYSAKMIYFYLLSYAYGDWEKYAAEIQETHGEMENFTQMLSSVNENTNKVLKMISVSRGHLLNDWYTIKTNNRQVQQWSVMLCIIIIATSLFQIYFVRRMFSVTGASTSKPRA